MKEWYLMDNYNPTVTSGYESNSISEFAQNNFSDVLATSFADSVLVYNQDLSVSENVRCVIQGNSADTYLKSMERIGLFPIGTVKGGMYVLFEDRYWLITGYPSNNKVYEKATMRLCQYLLRWQKDNGAIVERWASVQSSSKYDDGLNEGENLALTSDSIMLLTPNDDETLTLDGKRIFIDKKAVPDKVYLVSRTDSVLYDYGESHGGIFCFITEKRELIKDVDRPDLRLCDYIARKADDECECDPQPTSGKIIGESSLKVGIYRKYSAEIKDEGGNIVPWDNTYKWEIIGLDDVFITEDGEQITLKVEDDMLVGEKFKLQLSKDSDMLDELCITIRNAF